jgi:hypothetical protein
VLRGPQEAYSSQNAAAGWQPAETEVLLGVVAPDVRVGVRALRDWCQALGLPYRLPTSRVDGITSIAAIPGSVYIKYMSISQVRRWAGRLAGGRHACGCAGSGGRAAGAGGAATAGRGMARALAACGAARAGPALGG